MQRDGEGPERAAAVAQAVLPGAIELCEGAPCAVDQEVRIVAESAAAARLREKRSANGSERADVRAFLLDEPPVGV
jgi:hypothetical protein